MGTQNPSGKICNKFEMKLVDGKRNPWRILEKFPPVLVRLLAKKAVATKHVRAVSDEEIAIRAGLTLDKVRHISKQTSWDKIPIGDAEKFCTGCGFDPFNCYDRNRAMAYNRTQPSYTYLKVSPYWMTTFKPLIAILHASNSQN